MTTATVFLRLLAEENKGAALAKTIDGLRDGDMRSPDIYEADPSSFRLVPTAPFAYWVSQRVRRKFVELPGFEGDGRTVKQGLATADDFRFVRAWWEVATERILDGGNGPYQDIAAFQTWCRQRTHEEKRWVPFAKGGEYSPFYADVHLVVNWSSEGSEIKNRINEETAKPFSNVWQLKQTETRWFYLPGLTWPLRTQGGLSFRPVPAGSAFGHKGPVAFATGRELPALLGITNSAAFLALVSMQMAFGAYEVGVIRRTPLPYTLTSQDANAVAAHALESVRIKRDFTMSDETSHAAVLPALLSVAGQSLADRLRLWQGRVWRSNQRLEVAKKAIDALAATMYGVQEDQAGISAASLAGADVHIVNGTVTDGEDLGIDESPSDLDERYLVASTVSYALGCAFGRWDVRIAVDPTMTPKLADPFAPLPVCPPGMLVGPNGFPASQETIASEPWMRSRPDVITAPFENAVDRSLITGSEYPLRIAWDGILVDDPDHPDNVVRRVREVFALVWPDGAVDAEQEACELLGVPSLSDYFRRPSFFFADHLKRYSKSRRQAPIYWPLSTASGSYTVWLYYPRLTAEMLFTAINYVHFKIIDVERELREQRSVHSTASGREASRLLTCIEELTMLLAELNDLRDELERVAQLPYRPNLDDGVIINAAPLHRLFRLPKWAKDTRDVWQKLERGDYDWAHMAYTIWPERVRDKCRFDRSLAIAHNLEHLHTGPAPSASKRRSRQATITIDEDDE